MNHPYRVLEVDGKTGVLYPTDKVIMISAKFDASGRLMGAESAIIQPLFDVYGFDATYVYCYHIRQFSSEDTIRITYAYSVEGVKDTWVLKRGL